MQHEEEFSQLKLAEEELVQVDIYLSIIIAMISLKWPWISKHPKSPQIVTNMRIRLFKSL